MGARPQIAAAGARPLDDEVAAPETVPTTNAVVGEHGPIAGSRLKPHTAIADMLDGAGEQRRSGAV